MNIRDRIVDVVYVRLGDVEEHPNNWRVHNDNQKNAAVHVISNLGWAGAPLVYRSERLGGKLVYLDGHMRRNQFPDLVARVAVTDLSDYEADQFILRFNPIGSMAHANIEKLLDLAKKADDTGLAIVRNIVPDLDVLISQAYTSEPVSDDDLDSLPISLLGDQPSSTEPRFSPSIEPKIAPVQVSSDDVLEKQQQLETKFQQATQYITVVCPDCGEKFFIREDDL